MLPPACFLPPYYCIFPYVCEGGGVPGAHVEANGVVVGGKLGCFYSYSPSAVYCYDPKQAKWSSMPCSVQHKGGAIAVSGSTVAVAGGFDEKTSRPTAVIDIFDVAV
jgi:hypothetical protein